MEVQPVIAFKAGRQRAAEFRVDEQPRHFVFVLAGQQFEVVTRHGLRQRRTTSADSCFALPYLFDQCDVAPGIGRILIGRQGVAATFDHLVEIGGQLA